MPRKKTGSVDRSEDGKRLRIRVTVTDDKNVTRRPWLAIDPRFDDAAARRIAMKFTAEQQGKPFNEELFRHAKRPGEVLTVDEYAQKLWLPSRAGKVKSIRSDRARYRLHVSPLIGSKTLAGVTADDLRDLVQALDEKAIERADWTGRDRFGKKSAVNCWALVGKLFDDATNSKLRELRLLTKNPALGVKPPDPPKPVELQWLYPSELRQLLACDKVPLFWRRLYAVAVYCYTRPGETLSLTWGNGVDLQHGMVRVSQQFDHIARVYRETKTEATRHFAVEPVLRPLLDAMRREDPRDELVFPPVGKLAETLREHLLLAGVTRPALHERSDRARPIRFHDLRATGVTYMAIRGDSDNHVRERAGHADFDTTLLYIRRGQLAAAAMGDPYAPLPPGLLGESSSESSSASGADSRIGGNHAVSVGAGEGIRILPPSGSDGEIAQTQGSSKGKNDAPTNDAAPRDDSQDDSKPRYPLVARAYSELAILAQIEPETARPGLAVCRAFDATVRGDRETALAILKEEALAAGGER